MRAKRSNLEIPSPSARNDAGENGQVTVFVLLLVPFIIMIFLTVVYISLMVNAKINLQNAADLAAMAGAAEQARVMTMIGIKNYELKKNLKEFAYTLNIIHNWEQKRYFETANPPSFCAVDSLRGWVDDDDKDDTSFGTISPCENYNITIPPSGAVRPPDWVNISNPFLFPINYALDKVVFFGPDSAVRVTCEKANIANLIHLRGKDFEGNTEIPGSNDTDRGDLNIFYDTSIDLLRQIEEIESKFNSLSRQQPITLNSQNIRSNNSSSSDAGTLKQLLLVDVPDVQNPNVLARKTAEENLSKANTPTNKFFNWTYGEISLKLIKQDYRLWFTRFVVKTDGPNGSSYCSAIPLPSDEVQFPPNPQASGVDVDPSGHAFIMNMPIGVYQEENKPTFYAVRLETDVKLPFPLNKISDRILLRRIIAYAAAKPFGAKIGPKPGDLDQNIYRSNAIIVPNYSIPELGGSFESPSIKRTIRDTFYKTLRPNSVPLGNDDDERKLQRIARHNYKNWGLMRRWARAPKSNEFGNYIFNLSMINPDGQVGNHAEKPILTQNGGLDYHDFYIGQNFIQTPNVDNQNMLSKLLQEPYRTPARAQKARNGYSVKLISFDEIEQSLPPNSEWRDKTKNIYH